ncbi:hypothetical protein RIR_jg39831.t1 [Rhizophagus irregularis DAOM 181602=DAOM 197198]|nr:hypothetical protein RIR_jg39831.t1 [Rhizophagus irregularis DAOM 181602=DAOM 197198]
MNIYPNELVIFVYMLKDQAKLIHQLGSIQIDLTFKRVKVLSYVHVYTNVTTAEGYQQLFTDLFNVIKNLTGQAVKFRHIDGNGIECIIGDLDPIQAKGLELILQSTRNGKNKPILVNSTNIKAESLQPKRKGQFASTRNSKQCKITENNTENIDFDIEERKIALKKRELQICVQEAAARKALAKAEANGAN